MSVPPRVLSVPISLIIALGSVLFLFAPFTAQAAQSSCPVISRVLSNGASGTDVQELQHFLLANGFLASPLYITGYYGALTRDAVQRFQGWNHVVSTGTPETTGYGVVGPHTNIAIQHVCAGMAVSAGPSVTATSTESALDFSRPLFLGTNGDDVAALQQFLKDKGFYAYSTITGYFGPITEAAVKAFQVANGIDPVGYVGPQSRAKILALSAPISPATAATPSLTPPQPSAPTLTPPSSSAGGVYGGGNSNASGGGGSPTPVSPTPDTTPPTVSLTAPANNATVSGASVSLSATASDNVGVAGVQFTIDGTNAGSEQTSAPYSFVWDSTSVADGSHSITATACDAAGNCATSSAITLTVDNTPPIRSAGSPSGTLTLNTTSTTISLTTNEAATCKYATTPGVAYDSMTAFTTTGSTSHSSPISGLTNGGSYIYYVKCQDTSGNTDPTDYTISFTVRGRHDRADRVSHRSCE